MATLAAVAGFFVGAIHAEVAVVLNSSEGTISVIDKARMTETRCFHIGKELHHLMASADDPFRIVARGCAFSVSG